MQSTELRARLRAFPTARQIEFYDYIRGRLEMTGASPSFKEIACHFDVQQNAVVEMMRRLKKQGLIEWEPGKGRTLRLTPLSPWFLGTIN